MDELDRISGHSPHTIHGSGLPALRSMKQIMRDIYRIQAIRERSITCFEQNPSDHVAAFAVIVNSLPEPLKGRAQTAQVHLHKFRFGTRSLQGANESNRQQEECFFIAKIAEEFPWLRSLMWNHSQLTTVPVTLGLLHNLVDLDLSHNCLVEIPSEIHSLAYLERLDVSNNRIRFIRHDFGHRMTSLKEFFVRHNSLVYLPFSFIALLSQGTEIYVSGNPLDYAGVIRLREFSPRQQILTGLIREYYCFEIATHAYLSCRGRARLSTQTSAQTPTSDFVKSHSHTHAISLNPILYPALTKYRARRCSGSRHTETVEGSNSLRVLLSLLLQLPWDIQWVVLSKLTRDTLNPLEYDNRTTSVPT